MVERFGVFLLYVSGLVVTASGGPSGAGAAGVGNAMAPGMNPLTGLPATVPTLSGPQHTPCRLCAMMAAASKNIFKNFLNNHATLPKKNNK